MANKEVTPSVDYIRRKLDEGLSHQQIADAWEKDSDTRVSRSAISMKVNRSGLQSNNPRTRHEDLLPWHVQPQHRSRSDARNLRSLGRERRGKALKPNDRQRLRAWQAKLREADAVIRYEPNTQEGFFWVPRLPIHGADIIDRTNLADD